MSDIERPGPNSARVVRDYDATPEELLAAVRRAIEDSPRWRLQADGDAGIKATRKTFLLRFTDDVEIRVEARGGGSRLEATSRSRIGKSDLGQNPRNLQELLDAVERALRAGGV